MILYWEGTMMNERIKNKKEISKDLIERMHRYWCAANYLSVGQIYLLDNPLLKKSLSKEHLKPRLLGHWGTTPGLNFIYVHLNRVIKEQDLNVLYVTGPGHGGPALVANTYLEGTYSEVYPNITQDENGMRKLFKQFSFPGGIPSHIARVVRRVDDRLALGDDRLSFVAVDLGDFGDQPAQRGGDLLGSLATLQLSRVRDPRLLLPNRFSSLQECRVNLATSTINHCHHDDE